GLTEYSPCLLICFIVLLFLTRSGDLAATACAAICGGKCPPPNLQTPTLPPRFPPITPPITPPIEPPPIPPTTPPTTPPPPSSGWPWTYGRALFRQYNLWRRLTPPIPPGFPGNKPPIPPGDIRPNFPRPVPPDPMHHVDPSKPGPNDQWNA